jgi:hypothetical protein
MVDRGINPNAENLNFAVRAEAVVEPDNWEYTKDGRKHLDNYVSSRPEKKQE